MYKVFRYIILFSICLLFAFHAEATHNRSGEITYEQIGPLTIRATITTYTKASSTSADRDSLLLNWGDDLSEMVPRFNGTGELIQGEDIKKNLYIAEHTYPGVLTYTLSFEDPNRVNNIVNVNFPNSVDVPFFVSTTFTLVQTQFQGFNNSVILLQPPIDFACANKRFIHNPNAYDVDGDSLSYELVVPLQAENEEVPFYKYPNEVSPGTFNQISLNEQTGDFIWESPQQIGEYNIAIKINEFRNGVLLNSVIRDMQIRVEACQSEPPTIEAEDEICVIAGEVINLPITIDDVDPDDLVRISATGGPFQQSFSPAVLTASFDFQNKPLNTNIIWETKCEHIAETYYQIVVKAQDNSINSQSGLTELKTIRIKVVGPPPENVDSEAEDNSISITWDFPYACQQTNNNYFIGFNVWRKLNSNNFDIDSCETGLDNRGYEIIEFLTSDVQNDKYFYTDDDVEKGKTYCYRVLALFAQTTSSGNPFNIVESLPSNETCIQLQQDLPLLTKASVTFTDQVNGSVALEWIKPLTTDFDTIENPGPYRYQIQRSSDGQLYEEINSGAIETTHFIDSTPLEFLDTNLNTVDNQYHYIIDFYSNNNYYSSSPSSSTVFLSVINTDKEIMLKWDAATSWQNYEYKILKKRMGAASFDSILVTTENEYNDKDVLNNEEYCYLIESTGSYGLPNTPSPLINFSQEKCGTPIDTIGPCPPVVLVDNPCTENNETSQGVDPINTINWQYDDNTCSESEDLIGFNIYYAGTSSEELSLIAELDADVFSFDHIPDEGIRGCYEIAAVDSLGNEGEFSPLICVNNCPVYILPNTFTPNNDGANDLFTPRENRFVSQIDLKIFNTWGNLIFETQDPEINWNGQDDSGKSYDQGTYYYTCRIFDFSFEGTITEVDYISGYVQILR